MNQNLIRQAGICLADVLTGTGPADAKLGAFFRENRDLGMKERGFIAETVYGILRRKSYLAFVSQTEDPRVLVIAYLVKVLGKNLRDLEGIINDQQIEWLKAIKAVNTENLSPALTADLPEWLWDKLSEQFGAEEALTIARSMHQPASLDLRVNTLKGTRDEVIAQFNREKGAQKELAQSDLVVATPYSPTGIRMPQKVTISKHVLFEKGVIEVQDEGSQLLALLVAPKRGEMIADFCAGAGGKTLAIGALMKNTGRLYAFDVSEKRLTNLGKRLKRSGLSNLQAQVISSENDPKLKRLNAKFDRVLVDAPCSGLGTLRRNPDLKWKQMPKDIAELQVKQANILNRAAKLVKGGGRLIYATCSLLRDENEQIAEAFLAENTEFSLMPAHEILKIQNVPLNTGDYLKLSPHVHQTDGFFAAVFVKKAAPKLEKPALAKEIIETPANDEAITMAGTTIEKIADATLTEMAPKAKRVTKAKATKA